jgi:hypothetical protein
LDWKDVKADHIVIRAVIAKAGARRYAPISTTKVEDLSGA